MTRMHIGLGSNVGDRLDNLREALTRIGTMQNTSVLAVSSAVESEAWPDPSEPPYANAVAVIETPESPDVLLGEFQEIEREMGRDFEAPRNSPRVIDLDILLAGDDEWESEFLTLPHPRMAEREFVIVPLLEVDPLATWTDGSAVTRSGVRVGRITGSLGPIPGFEARTRRAEPAGAPVAPGEGEEWVAVYKHATMSLPHGSSPNFVMGGFVPDAEAPLVEVVLSQEGIPFVWDPFDPKESTDPYGFRHPYQLMVPLSSAEQAKRLIEEVTSAPFDPSDMLADSE